MNRYATYALFALFATVLVAPSYAQESGAAIVVDTDSETYDHKSKIKVTGNVESIRSGVPVTYKVTNPMGSVVTVGQNSVDGEGAFAFTLNTKGPNWKYDGEYIIRVQYGSESVNNWTPITLTDGIMPSNVVTPPESTHIAECSENSISVKDKCVPYTLTSGMLMDKSVHDMSIKLYVNTEDGDGMLKLSELRNVLIGTHTVLVDGQQWDDVEIDENTVMVMYPAGTTTIEVFGTKVIPEFGTIAAIILAIAVTSVIAITARTKLGIQPRL